MCSNLFSFVENVQNLVKIVGGLSTLEPIRDHCSVRLAERAIPDAKVLGVLRSKFHINALPILTWIDQMVDAVTLGEAKRPTDR